MTDMTLLPTSGFGGEAGAAALGGGVGGLIGSWFGNGFGGGWGGRGAVVAGGGADAAISIAGSAANMLTTALVSDIASLQTGVNSLGLNLMQGQGTTNLAIANSTLATLQGQNNNLTSITAQNNQNMIAGLQGFSSLETSVQAGNYATLTALAHNNQAALERSYQAQLAAQECCCETNRNIEMQAEQTRALMRDQFAQSQAVLICDLKSQLQEARFANSQLAQTAQLNCKINQVEQLVNFKIPTPPTPPTGCC